jgi:GMP synthase (glutamine-hydrolysing)
MNILCFTHADFETPGVITDWAKARGDRFDVVSPYKGESIPKTDGYDLLVVMGGPQSATRYEEYPYLVSEVEAIRTAIQQNKKIIGFCLGAQLIGAALGAKAERSPEKEVGVYPITLTSEGRNDPLLADMPETFDVIHWHNDMPGLGEDSVVLATSAGCPRQIVRYSPRLYGFQCHLEITREGIETMTLAVPEDLAPSRFTQSRQELIAQDYVSIHTKMIAILNRFTT